MQGVKTLISKHPGPTITIMGGVHGNEPSGIRIVQNLMDKYEQINQGTLHLILANPLAISSNQRCVETNMNRAFIEEFQPQTQEETRAQELLPLLKSTDILIDIHNTLRPNTQPFVICESPDHQLCGCFGISKIVSGLAEIHAGSSDAYVARHGGVGICLEVGSALFPQLEPQVVKCIDALLFQKPLSALPLEHYKAKELRRAKAIPWIFEEQWGDFDFLAKGSIIGYEG